MGPIDALVETFGPFLIPAVAFAIGIGFYVVLWWIGRTNLVE